MEFKKAILYGEENKPIRPITTADRVMMSSGESLEHFTEYSLEEKVIGKWIDGKPIYRKVLVIDNPTNGRIAHHIDNLDNIISINGIAKTNEQQWEPLEDFVRSANTYRVSVRSFNESTFYFEQLFFQATKLTVILEYTKTTD